MYHLMYHPRQMLLQECLEVHGVDVSDSAFFCRPAVLRAVEFAAAAHAGQVRGEGA